MATGASTDEAINLEIRKTQLLKRSLRSQGVPAQLPSARHVLEHSPCAREICLTHGIYCAYDAQIQTLTAVLFFGGPCAAQTSNQDKEPVWLSTEHPSSARLANCASSACYVPLLHISRPSCSTNQRGCVRFWS